MSTGIPGCTSSSLEENGDYRNALELETHSSVWNNETEAQAVMVCNAVP